MSYIRSLFSIDNMFQPKGEEEQATPVRESKGLIKKPFELEIPEEVEVPKVAFYNEYSALKELEDRIKNAKSQQEMPEGTGPDTVTNLNQPLTKATKKISLKGKEEFIAELYPTAIEVGKEIGVDPRIIVAQAAIETGWGKHAPGNNYFGIKSHGMSGGQVLTTKEVVNGKTITIKDSFRSFESPKDSVRGYGEFIKANPRYREFSSAKSLEDQVQALGRSGYATDPNYANKIYSIATGLPPISAFGEISSTSPVKNPYKERRGR